LRQDEIERILKDIQARLLLWLTGKPNGQFMIEINVNEGGVRGRPKVTITETL
jgi:hypothetical protein